MKQTKTYFFKVLCLLFFVLVCFRGVAQTPTPVGLGDWNEYNRIRELFNTLQKDIGIPDIEKFDPNAYYSPEFSLAKVIFAERSYGEALVRYNTYLDKMEVKLDTSTIFYLKSDMGISVNFQGSDFKTYNYIKDDEKKTGFFEVLVDGKDFDLLKKYSAEFVQGKKAKTSFHRDKKSEIKSSASYYIHFNNENLPLELKRFNKNFLSQIFKKDKNLLKRLINECNLDLKSEKDLKIFVGRINEN